MRKTHRLPLPPNYFGCPPLTQHATDGLEAEAAARFDEVLRTSTLQTQTESTIQWSLDVATTPEFHIYSGDDCTASPGTAAYLATTQVQATLEDVQAAFQVDSPNAFHGFCTAMQLGALDSASLYTFPTTNATYLGVRWLALRSPHPFVRPRDACLLEYHKAFTADDGSRGFARSISSVSLPFVCPDMQATLGTVRFHLRRGGYVFRQVPNRRGMLHCTVLFQAHANGTVPSWLAKLEVRRLVQAVAQWAHSLQRQPTTGSNQQVKIDHAVERFRRCRMCGHGICSMCPLSMPPEGSVCSVCSTVMTAPRLRRQSIHQLTLHKHNQESDASRLSQQTTVHDDHFEQETDGRHTQTKKHVTFDLTNDQSETTQYSDADDDDVDHFALRLTESLAPSPSLALPILDDFDVDDLVNPEIHKLAAVYTLKPTRCLDHGRCKVPVV
ncbi:Aste57867_8469 [Aphanomyces stellatus]|uniref:Aste57867_8469 protein n=1 Tax=Aphanomyces stellatus TaxID=120398 RepID=A0A485KKB5_9STRA|nr:hypothetical protein As57867_008437 [Aphanomyces stellatus]VFT85355.1 Aste57867_8469 [Aphanomyces stellatus]